MPDIPTVDITMLGPSRSGKTVFLHAMYATLAAGVDGYYLLTVDPDIGLDLMDAWEDMTQGVKTPEPSDDRPITYEFHFKEGFDRLARIVLQDFRGGALRARQHENDARPLRDRLAVSQSIYIVLDGEDLATWLGRPEGTPPDRILELQRIHEHLQRAVDDRRAHDDTALPSFVILITKMDLLDDIPGMDRRTALRRIPGLLREPLSTLFGPGVTTLICPVTVGELGTRADPQLHEGAVRPQGVDRPLAFSLRSLHDQALLHQGRELRDAEDDHLTRSTRLDEARKGFFRRLWNAEEIGVQQRKLDAAGTDLDGRRRAYQEFVSLADRLRARVGNLPVIRDGVVTRYLAGDRIEGP